VSGGRVAAEEPLPGAMWVSGAAEEAEPARPAVGAEAEAPCGVAATESWTVSQQHHVSGALLPGGPGSVEHK
jgi:hypothetical protein